MARQIGEDEVRRRFEFVSGIRFELFYSLATLLGPAGGALENWRAEANARVSGELRRELAHFGSSPFFWIVLADALGSARPSDAIESLLADFGALDPTEFTRRILVGAIHDADVAERVLTGKVDLDGALHELPPEKREWLEHIELYPPVPGSGMFRAVAAVVNEPADSLARLRNILSLYHRDVFKASWTGLAPRLEESLATKCRLFEATSLEEFFRLALLRVEVDSENGLLRAIRGGYELPYANLRIAYVLPSVFNTGRYWTDFTEESGVVAFLPYFDPEIAIGPAPSAAPPAMGHADPSIDVALVFKALGDATRFAIASLIARTPMSSAQIADALKVSRPTVSHHVVLLREASLLHEESRAGSVFLSLRRKTLEALSSAALRRFYGDL